MRAVVTRVSSASVAVAGEKVGELGAPGLLVLLGVGHGDGPREIEWMSRKIWGLRILAEERSASEVGAPILVISQFTLYGDARKGRRPSWTEAARVLPPSRSTTRSVPRSVGSVRGSSGVSSVRTWRSPRSTTGR